MTINPYRPQSQLEEGAFQCQQWTAELAETNCKIYGPCGADGAASSSPSQLCGTANRGGGEDDEEILESSSGHWRQNRGSSSGGGGGGRGLLGGSEHAQQDIVYGQQHQSQHIIQAQHEEQPYSWGRPERQVIGNGTATRQRPENTDPLTRRGGLLGGGMENGGGKENGHGHGHNPDGTSNGHTHTNKSKEDNSGTVVPDLMINPSQDDSIGASTVGGEDGINLLPSFDYSHYAVEDESRVAAASPHSSVGQLEPLHEDRPTETSWANLVATGAAGGSPSKAAAPQRRGICDDDNAVVPTCDTVDMSCGGLHSMTSFDDACHGKDMLEAEESISIPPEAPDSPALLHGIPTFVSALSTVFVTKVSAHPSGSHVLLISREALLFSYGRNRHGQLGNGRQEDDFVRNPAIVTPLLERGGKTIDCAAGVNHSLVIVQTIGDRVGLQSSSSLSDESTSPALTHHQVYAFGRNDYMKLGLNDPSSDPSAPSAASPKQRSSRKNGNASTTQSNLVDEGTGLEDDVLLPRSVRLGVTFTPCPQDGENANEGLNLPRRGIFAIAASDHHSAALVRTDADVIELYTWGKASRGALGLGSHVREVGGRDPSRAVANGTDKVAKPTIKKRVSALPRAVAIPNIIQSLSKRPIDGRKPYPSSISLGPECTAVLMSNGRVITFGSSSDGLLGLGKDIETMIEPTEITFGDSSSSNIPTSIAKISHGSRHAIAIAKDGSAFSWGLSDHGRLGYRPQGQDLLKGVKILKQIEKKGKESKSDKRRRIIWSPRKIHFHESVSGLVNACAGFDNTVFHAEAGDVLSCGRMSGRLGQGEIMSDVHHPSPMFGGLWL